MDVDKKNIINVKKLPNFPEAKKVTTERNCMETKDEQVTVWDCPKPGCDGKLIKRKNKTTGDHFLGCTNYPKCTYTQKDDTDKQKDDYLLFR